MRPTLAIDPSAALADAAAMKGAPPAWLIRAKREKLALLAHAQFFGDAAMAGGAAVEQHASKPQHGDVRQR